MAHFHIDGTLVVAKLKRNLMGGAIYQDVTVRDAEGAHRTFGRILALDDIRSAMTPGSKGRFYFYDVMGTKGIYGARLIAGRAHAYFPYRWNVLTFALGTINVLVALAWWLLNGSYAPFAMALGLTFLISGVVVARTRVNAMRRYREDDACAPTAAELHPAELRA